MTIEIIPAVMPESLLDLRSKLNLIRGITQSVQIDVMDGVFVPSKDWPYTSGGPQEFAKIVNEEESLPFWDDFDFEVDLMVNEPESVVDDWIRAGVKRIILHIESTEHLGDIITLLREKFSRGGEFNMNSVELGLSLNTTTDNSKLDQFLDSVDFVQFMGIEKIGYQGQGFDERVIPKIEALRGKYPDTIISVDGGVSLETASRLISAGANRLVSGSAIFESNNIRETIEKFKDLPS